MRALFLLGLLTAGLQAAPVITLTPSANLTAAAGGITGWGFEITTDSQYAISILGTFLADPSDAAFGSYTDIVGMVGGPDAGYVGAGTNWVRPFVYDADPFAASGMGWFEEAPGASGVFTALLHVDYEVYEWIGNAPGDYVGTESVELPVSLTVDDTVVTPEPGSWITVLGLAVVAWRKVRG